MAQYTPKPSDDSARTRVALASKVLREFQNEWLLSDRVFPTREVLAALLAVFAFDFHRASFLGYVGITAEELWRRSLVDWLAAVGTPASEYARLAPHRLKSECAELIERFCTELSNAAASWELKGPDQPACEGLVQRMFEELASQRFVTIRHG